MNRIVEAFTRPHYQVTAMDELVQSATVLLIVGVFCLVIWYASRSN